MEQKQKFSSTFYKRWQITKTASLFALRRVRNSRVELVQLLSSGAFLKVWKLFAREKVFTNCRIVQTIPEKFPVGSFRQQKPYFTNTDSWNIIFIDLFLMVSVQTAEKSPTGRFFWKVHIVCLSRGLFSYKSPLFFNPNLGLKNSPTKALSRIKSFDRCDERLKALPLESATFWKRWTKTFIFALKLPVLEP